ncbi:MAG: hypothetical protein M0009_09265 [Deltaproteobacteria bacterium]|nr:hypothetical protein [Deltaproteobacteria bacterium]
MKKTGKVVIGMVLGLIMVASMAWAATDNKDGTIDAEGIVWLKDGRCLGPGTWAEAKTKVAQLHDGVCGLKDGSQAGDWRLPDEVDLSHRSRDYAAFNAYMAFYWSSTRDARYANGIIIVGIGGGGEKVVAETSRAYVWAVRNKR